MLNPRTFSPTSGLLLLKLGSTRHFESPGQYTYASWQPATILLTGDLVGCVSPATGDTVGDTVGSSVGQLGDSVGVAVTVACGGAGAGVTSGRGGDCGSRGIMSGGSVGVAMGAGAVVARGDWGFDGVRTGEMVSTTAGTFVGAEVG
jgi:hypothetical protein